MNVWILLGFPHSQVPAFCSVLWLFYSGFHGIKRSLCVVPGPGASKTQQRRELRISFLHVLVRVFKLYVSAYIATCAFEWEILQHHQSSRAVPTSSPVKSTFTGFPALYELSNTGTLVIYEHQFLYFRLFPTRISGSLLTPFFLFADKDPETCHRQSLLSNPSTTTAVVMTTLGDVNGTVCDAQQYQQSLLSFDSSNPSIACLTHGECIGLAVNI